MDWWCQSVRFGTNILHCDITSSSQISKQGPSDHQSAWRCILDKTWNVASTNNVNILQFNLVNQKILPIITMLNPKGTPFAFGAHSTMIKHGRDLFLGSKFFGWNVFNLFIRTPKFCLLSKPQRMISECPISHFASYVTQVLCSKVTMHSAHIPNGWILNINSYTNLFHCKYY